jgi:hypothetical protein
VDRFVAIGSVEKSKNMRKPPVNDELLNIYANEQNKVQKKKSLRKLSLQADVPLSTC